MKFLIVSLALVYSIVSSWASDFRPNSTRVSVPVAGTAVRLFASARLAGNAVVQADPNNTGQMFVGGSSVDSAARNGIILDPGSSASFEDLFPNTGSNFYDLSEFWVDSAVNGESVVVTFMESF